jgi:putative transcriptional regulator
MENKLKLHRLLAGEMTQAELAKRAGVARQTIIAIEQGRFNPSVKLALLLAEALNTTVEKLFTLEEEDR